MFPTRRITTTGGDKFRDEFSLAFDGSNDFIQLSGSHLAVANNFTIVAWVKRGETGSGHCIYSANDSTSDGARLVIDSNDDLILRLNGGDISSDTSIISEFKAGVWYHVVGVYDDDNNIATLYADGVDVTTSGEASQSRAIGVTATPRIGNRADTNSILFNGNISEVAIYDKALSASEVKTLYNGREPYNHKEGVCSSNLQGWWRMGDGSANNRRFQYIENSASSAGSKLIMSSTFDSDEDGWVDYSSGTVARSTDISSHSGGAGVLKCVNDATNHWLGKTANITSGMESGKIYIAEGYVYIPSSWSGSNDIYMYSADQFGDTNINIGRHDYNMAQVGTKDEWQHIFYTFLCQENSGSGSIYLRSSGTSNLEDGDFVYFDDFKITEIDKLNSGVMLNMKPEDFEGESF